MFAHKRENRPAVQIQNLCSIIKVNETMVISASFGCDTILSNFPTISSHLIFSYNQPEGQMDSSGLYPCRKSYIQNIIFMD